MKKPSLGANPLALVLLLSGVFFTAFLLISGILFLSKSPPAAANPGSIFRAGNGVVGLVELTGIIMDSKTTVEQLDKLDEQNDVKAVVLRLNSPGGAVAPSQEIYERVKAMTKPVVVSMGSVAASGAFYISLGSKTVFANPGTLTGSIGVIMEFANIGKLYDWAKVHRYSIRAGKFKGTGAEYREMTPEERELIQGTVDDVMVQFKAAVAHGRSLSEDQVDAIADGRVMTGQQAKEALLVDRLGTLGDAIAEAGKQGKIQGKPKVVKAPKKKRGLMALLMDESNWGRDDEAESRSHGSLAGVLDQFARWIAAESGGAIDVQAPLREPGLYLLWSGAGGGK